MGIPRPSRPREDQYQTRDDLFVLIVPRPDDDDLSGSLTGLRASQRNETTERVSITSVGLKKGGWVD